MLEPIPHEPAVLYRRSELVVSGYTDRDIKAALRSGRWLRIRTGAYARRDAWELLLPDTCCSPTRPCAKPGAPSL